MSLLRLQSVTVRLRLLSWSKIRVTRHDAYEDALDELFERELRSPEFRINLKRAPEKDGPTLVHMNTTATHRATTATHALPPLPIYKQIEQRIDEKILQLAYKK